jgi:hypothetical protein
VRTVQWFGVLALAGVWSTAAVASESPTDFFESRVRPILVEHCYRCHSAEALTKKKLRGGLMLDTRDGILKGGDTGPAIVPGRPEASLLIKAVGHAEKDLKMPPKKMLPAAEIALLTEWVRKGAPDPRAPVVAAEAASLVTDDAWEVEFQKRLRWWSLQPMRRTEPPKVQDEEWSHEPVDRFVRAALDSAKLPPAPPADPEALARRLSFVLTGLPPSATVLENFTSAYATNPTSSIQHLVSSLLASPHFGERFARHWMDVVRYTDTYGYEWDTPAKGAYEYRDYLIRAFNDDIGFDQMLREQLAGDLLPQQRIHPQAGTDESLIAPMFYHMGEHRHGSSLMFNGIHQDMVNNKIDAFSKAFLATTVACARCHDHNLEAVSQHDYYALAAVFTTPRWTSRVIDAPGKNDPAIAKLKELRTQIRGEMAKEWEASLPALQPDPLRRWARAHPQFLEGTKPGEVAYPLARLSNTVAWLEPKDISASSKSDTLKLAAQADGSFLATGGAPATDTYTVHFTTAPGKATLLRLEALADDRLPKRGPGLTNLGNFVLNELKVEVKPLESPGTTDSAPAMRQVVLASATADYSQPNYAVESVLSSGRRKGWAVGLGPNVDRTARFNFAAPVDLPQGGEWTVTLVHHYGDQHLLGRFRLTPGVELYESNSDSARQEGDHVAAARWTELAAEWRTTREARQKANAAFKPLADFHDASFPKGWVIEGDGMTHGYVEDATPLVALEGDPVIARLLTRGFHTHALSSKLPGALRMPPELSVPGKMVSLNLAGGEFAGHLVVDDHAFQNETITFFTNPEPQWKSYSDAALMNGVQQVTVEWATSSLNPNFPPRTGLSKGLKYQDFGYDKRSWLSITGIVSHDAGGAPQDEFDAFAALYEGKAPATVDEAWARFSKWFSQAVDRWCCDELHPGDRELLDWLLAKGLLPNKATPGSKLAALVSEYRQVEGGIAFPRTVNSMDEREVAKCSYPINVRGSVDAPGELVTPDFLRMFSGRNSVATSKGSGRLELAESLLDPEHPLTARVYVNRVWQWIFGTGLVATPDDFGRLGDKPSNPELLDWLAREFIREGWSTKKLVRRLVLSQTFRQSSVVSDVARERDPANRLLQHYPTRRLEAEEIRDSLLAVSGRLDPQLYGRPILPFRPVEDGPKRLFSGALDGDGRRSVYLQMSIMDPPKFLVGFNLPDLKLPTGRRDVTNVPSQALIMLNDPFVLAMAKQWAAELRKAGTASREERLRHMFATAYGRQPHDAELPRWLSALEDFGGDSPDAWERLAHAFFNTKEFIYYR